MTSDHFMCWWISSAIQKEAKGQNFIGLAYQGKDIVF
jgi:hypothetical protein